MRTWTPRPGQKAMLDFAAGKDKCLLLGKPGSGKSMVAVTLALGTLAQWGGKILVVAPPIPARIGWARELGSWAATASLSVRAVQASDFGFERRMDRLDPLVGRLKISDPAGVRKRLLGFPETVHTVPWHLLWHFVERTQGEHWPYTTVILDELDYAQSHASKMFEAANHISHEMPVARVLGLSGTLSMDDPQQLWAPMQLIDNGKRLGKNITTMRTWWLLPSKVDKRTKQVYSYTVDPAQLPELARRVGEVAMSVPTPLDFEVVINDEYVELPDAARQAYREIKRQLITVLESGVPIEAPNAAALQGKLCLAAGTEVLTGRGWVPIETVAHGERVWDGVEWVLCDGAVCNGVRDLIDCRSIFATPDHQFLVRSGWRAAQEISDGESSEGLEWADVRLPDGAEEGGVAADGAGALSVGSLGGPVRLWGGSHTHGGPTPEHEPRAVEVLRVSTGRAGCGFERQPWDDGAPRLEFLARCAEPMRVAQGQGLRKLWGSGDPHVQAVAGELRPVLGGHAGDVGPRAFSGAGGERQRVQQSELPMGDVETTGQQQTNERVYRDPQGADDGVAGSAGVRVQAGHDLPADRTRLAPGRSVVFDIANAGPRSRFVARGTNGVPVIAHNCQIASGQVYDAGKQVQVVHTEKLERLEQLLPRLGPVVVFFWYQHEKAALLERFPHATDVREPRAVERFSRGEIPLLLAQWRSASHGIDTLQFACRDVLVYSPPFSASAYHQGLARVIRPGQPADSVTVHRLIASKTIDEDILFNMIPGKQALSESLLSQTYQ